MPKFAPNKQLKKIECWCTLFVIKRLQPRLQPTAKSLACNDRRAIFRMLEGIRYILRFVDANLNSRCLSIDFLLLKYLILCSTSGITFRKLQKKNHLLGSREFLARRRRRRKCRYAAEVMVRGEENYDASRFSSVRTAKRSLQCSLPELTRVNEHLSTLDNLGALISL